MIQTLITLLLITQISVESRSQSLQTIQSLSPLPKFRRARGHVYKFAINGCMFKETNNQFAIWYGTDCKYYPSSTPIKEKFLKIRMTGIQKIKKNDFFRLGNLTMLVLEHNLLLESLEPGCFRQLKNLTHLKMILNYQLKVLEENTFEGLDSLTHLVIRKNGFMNQKAVFPALTIAQVPNLIYLDLSENYFKNITEDDFQTLSGSNIEELQMSLCNIRYMHENSLISFKNLKSLRIDGNHFNLKNLRRVILSFVKHKIQLETLNLQDSGYRKKTPLALVKTIARTNISRLSLAENQFEVIDNKSFPVMEKIRFLDLSDNIIIFIEEGAFCKIRNLEELYLAGNKFAKVFRAILVPTLKVLDLSRISNKPTAVSYFTIENNIFQNLTKLEKLLLSYNLLESTNPKTFTGLKSLRYLEMKNTTIFNVRENSFLNTPNLIYLNLENNPFKAITLNFLNFAGLSKLEILLLGGSDITNLSNIPSPFSTLKSLVYLGLNSNVIYNLEPQTFEPLVTLTSLDLSNNKLLPWNKRLFRNNSVLKSVDLSLNKITLLTRAMLEDFKAIPELNLEENPFICDCNLLPMDSLQEVLTNYNNYSNVLDVNCTNTEFQNLTIKDFVYYLRNHTDFCQSKTSNNKVITIVVSSIMVVLFLVLVVFLYYYRYYVKYWIFLIKMAARRHSKWWKRASPMAPTSFQYDAFVSYSCSDNYFVSELVHKLENNEPHLKLCVYERDFKIGSIISEEIMQNIVKSKRTLLIISDGFAKSQWCRWETKLAEHHQLFFQYDDSMTLDDTLVMVKISDVSKKYITPTLKYLMKTRIYLVWDKEKEEEFWNKLRSTLAAPKSQTKDEKDKSMKSGSALGGDELR